MSCLGMMMSVKAQIAKWLIPPSYEKIQIVNGTYIMTDSAGTKTIWTMDGKRLLSSKDKIFSFKEGIALTVKPGTSTISMAYGQNGESIKFEGCDVTHDYPYYSNGKLLVKQEEYYRYADTYGKMSEGKYTNAYPYFNGYAVCDTYLNLEKRKDACHYLLDEKGKVVPFTFQGKEFNSDDLQFISSVNDENIGFVVIKEKVFQFDGRTKKLSPVFIKDNASQNLKEQAKLVSDFEQSYLKDTDSTYTLNAKCGKNGYISIRFDLMRRPKSMKRNKDEREFKVNKEAKKVLDSPLEKYEEDGLYGLQWDDTEEMLPPQFDEVITCFSNKALVKTSGKTGMLELFKDDSFKIMMNRGDDIAFRHQKVDTSIRADFPTYLPAKKVSLEIDPQTGCDIDKTSKESKNTDSGNFIQYNCVLNIPEEISDSLTTIEYPITVHYDGIKTSPIPFQVEAWYVKYFDVEVDNEQITQEKDTVTFAFNITLDRIAGDADYPMEVKVFKDSLLYECEKITEFRHKGKVDSLQEGINNIIIQITEKGCPPVSFPFEVEYHKPVAKTKNKPATKAKVTFNKKRRGTVTVKRKEKVSTAPKEEKPRPRVF